jgi:hypothetical protein
MKSLRGQLTVQTEEVGAGQERSSMIAWISAGTVKLMVPTSRRHTGHTDGRDGRNGLRFRGQGSTSEVFPTLEGSSTNGSAECGSGALIAAKVEEVADGGMNG